MTHLAALFRRLITPATFAAALLVAGCGIKGPLELPEGTQVSGKEGQGHFVPNANTRLPGYYETPKKEERAQRQLGKPVKPDEPFVLDPLIN